MRREINQSREGVAIPSNQVGNFHLEVGMKTFLKELFGRNPFKSGR